MRNFLKQNKSLWFVVALLGVLAIGGLVSAYVGDAPKVVVEGNYIESANPPTLDVEVGSGEEMLGATAVPNRLPHGYWDTKYGYYVDGTAVIDSSRNVSGVAGYMSTSLQVATTTANFPVTFNVGTTTLTSTSVGTSTMLYIKSDTASLGGQVILEDSDGGGCTAIRTVDGSVLSGVIPCPHQ